MPHIKSIFSFRKIAWAASFFILGICAGFILDRDHSFFFENVREKSARYKFINPLLFIDVADGVVFPEYDQLRDDLAQYTKYAISEGRATDISVYFRNLNGSQRISINPDDTFTPASMLKVVTLIATLREAESDPKLLSREVTLKGEDQNLVDSQVRYPTKNPIRSGNTYTVKTLLDHLIIESDNVANVALINLVGDEKIVKVYEDLRLPKPEMGNEGGYTVDQYSHLFRTLYNGTYLSRASSEKSLALLSQSEFKNGLVAGLPEGVTVAHKFGVKTVLSGLPDNKPSYRELHDCGIVYFPQAPYFLCVMTRGHDFSSLEKIIGDISSLTWKDIEKLNN